MDIDKKTEDPVLREIEFNWERVKEKALVNKDRLQSNAPKVVHRNYGRTSTTDEIIEPVIEVGNKSYVVDDKSLKPFQGEDDGPDKNVIGIVKGLKEATISGKDLTIDERRLVVDSLRLSGQSQDSIAELLGLSRRTIVNDYRELRKQAALRIQNTSTEEIAGEVYEVAKSCIRKAMAAGHYRTVSTLMRDMVELLQSLGMIYQAPRRSMQASLIGNLYTKQGYHKYMDSIGENRDKVIEVLDCMFDAISSNKLN